jgi:hypothetical protein
MKETPMSQPPRSTKLDADEIPVEIAELVATIQHLPVEVRRQVASSLERVVESTRRRRRILNLVQEALGQLRLDMKYLMFDLEATRRERDDYRRQVEGT